MSTQLRVQALIAVVAFTTLSFVAVQFAEDSKSPERKDIHVPAEGPRFDHVAEVRDGQAIVRRHQDREDALRLKRQQERKEAKRLALAQAEAVEAAEEEAASEEVATASSAPLCDASCVACESGGDPTIVSASGTYWGLYQFDYSTWVAHGGEPSAYGRAGAAEQHAVAARVTYDAWPNC